MEKSEPSLVPEWLRNSLSGTGNGGASHHFTPSQPDGLLLALPNRSNSSKSFGKSDHIRPFLDQSSSSNRRNSSSNGSAKQEKNQYYRSFSSFTRGQRDKGRGRLTIDDNWDADYSDPLWSIMSSRIEKDTLRRSQSMVSRKQSEVLHGRAYTDLRRTGQSNCDNGNSRLSVGGITGMEKVSFERDFPSLGSEERPITPDIGRIPSPGLTRSMQGLSIGNSSLIGGEGWTSALAEVPVGVGSNANASTSHLPAVASSPSATSSATAGLNMAETLVQAPSRLHIAQQPSVQDQKREELAIIQSMRLIPMTLSMPKNTVHNPSDKLKPKTAARSGDQLAASKPVMQLGTQSIRGANVKADGPKTSHTGKLLVLKPGRDNGVSLPLRDTSSSSGSVTSNAVNGHCAPISAPVAFKNSGSPKLSASTKTSAFIPKIGSILDNKPTSAKAQSRSDFFKLMRKKSVSSSSAHAESSTIVSSIREKSDQFDSGAIASFSPAKDDDEVKCNGDACTRSQGLSEFSNGSATLPDEEEAAFLRSLGWEENAGDDEGLTEEEINAFYVEYMKLRPASKLCQGLQLKMLGEAEPPATCSGGPTLEFSKSDSSA